MNRWKVLMFVAAVCGAGCADAIDDKTETGDAIDLTEGGEVDVNNDVEPANSVTPVEQVEPPTATPDPIALDGAVLACASAFITHDGEYLSATVHAAATGSQVEIQRHLTSVQEDGDVLPVTELVWSGEVPSTLVDGFFGFEVVDAFLVAEATEQPGLFSGTISGESMIHPDGPIALTCWSADLELPARYDAGTCVDEDGQPSHNDIPFAFAAHTGFGQCANFEGQLNGEAYGYPDFIGLDLRGANLDAASLHFANLIDADLRGASIATLEFGYARVHGRIDEFTVLPESQWCDAPQRDVFECMQ